MRKLWALRKRICIKDVLADLAEVGTQFDLENLERDEDVGADFNASAVDAFYKANGGAPVAETGRNGLRPVSKLALKRKAAD